jgi:hypothetical protein
LATNEKVSTISSNSTSSAVSSLIPSTFFPPFKREILLQYADRKVESRFHHLFYEALHNHTYEKSKLGKECLMINCRYYYRHAKGFLTWINQTAWNPSNNQ